MLDYLHLPLNLCPSPDTTNLAEWWTTSQSQISSQHTKAWSSAVQLVWWYIWKERNERIFRHKASNPSAVMSRIANEVSMWSAAGKVKIAELMNRPREPD